MHTIRCSRSIALVVFATVLAGPVAAAQSAATAGGDVATVTQKRLINHVIVGDSIEAEMAQLAANRSQNAAVKEFANQLAADQKAQLGRLNAFAANGAIGREADPSDTSGAHFAGQLASLKSMSADAGFDRAFVQDQIELHQAAIDALHNMRSAATDAGVQHDIDASLPVIEKHLAAAQQLGAQLNRPADAPPPAAAAAAPKADSTSQKADSAARPQAAKPPAAKPPVAKPPVAKPPV